jgi:hypothetical protein
MKYETLFIYKHDVTTLVCLGALKKIALCTPDRKIGWAAIPEYHLAKLESLYYYSCHE